jgi:dienelactone hydrolase
MSVSFMNGLPFPSREQIVLFHAAYGLRPAVGAVAEDLRAAGHVVYTPDLYDGEVFADRADAARKFQELGLDGILDRTRAPVRDLPETVVYAGFSNGGACAELLAATRPGAGRDPDARAADAAGSRLAHVAAARSGPDALRNPRSHSCRGANS